MPNGLVVLCGRVAFAFLGNDMQHFRSAVVFDLIQNTHQTYYVMTIGRAKITDVKTSEDIAGLLAERGFPVVVATNNTLPFLLVHEVTLDGQLIQPPAPFVIRLAGR